MRWSHVSDDDSQWQAVKSKDLLVYRSAEADSDGVSKCKAVYRSGVMECHDTMKSHVMGCHEEVVTSQVDSSWDGRCASFARIRCRQTKAETMSAME